MRDYDRHIIMKQIEKCYKKLVALTDVIQATGLHVLLGDIVNNACNIDSRSTIFDDSANIVSTDKIDAITTDVCSNGQTPNIATEPNALDTADPPSQSRKRRRSSSDSHSELINTKRIHITADAAATNLSVTPTASLAPSSNEQSSNCSHPIDEDSVSVRSYSSMSASNHSSSITERKQVDGYETNIFSCLMTLNEIGALIEEYDGSKSKRAKGEYTVKAIRQINSFPSTYPCFLVRWHGYSEADDTWEPLENISHLRVHSDFLAQHMKLYHTRILKFLMRVQNQVAALPSISSYAEMFKEFEKFHPSLLCSDLIVLVMMDMNRNQKSKQYRTIYDRCVNGLRLLPYYNRRKYQMFVLHKWNKSINAIDTANELTVENKVDLDLRPIRLQYINDVRPTGNIVIDDEPPVGCDCGPNGCNNQSDCCGKAQDAQMAYNKNGTVRVSRNVAIFECNKRCSCGPDCKNRVVQRGSSHQLCIFKTFNGRGWGVYTKRKIKRGQYICEYVGEIITSEEAERRDKVYEATGSTYVFDLDFNSNDNPYSVDATYFGNVSHFINHSCTPNMAVWPVWINCLNLDLPKLCLFALTDIEVGTELTFDYVTNAEQDDTTNGLTARHGKRSECLCGAENCKKFLF